MAPRNVKPKINLVKPRTNLVKTRKDLRKEKRINKKAKRRQFFSRNKLDKGQPVPEPEPQKETQESIKAAKTKERAIAKEKASKKRDEKAKRNRQERLLKENEEEDKVIKRLEKRLKLKKKKSGAVPKTFHLDGLNYLLEVCDRTESSGADKQLAEDSGSEFEEDFFIASGKKSASEKVKKSVKTFGEHSEDDGEQSENDNENFSDADGNDDDFESDEFSDKQESEESDEDVPHNKKANEKKSNSNTKATKNDDMKRKIDTDREVSKRKKNNEDQISSESDIGSFDEDVFGGSDESGTELNTFPYPDDDDELDSRVGKSDESDANLADGEKVNQKSKSGIWEDIYGRKRDKKGNIIVEETGKYIPPSLRQENTNSDSKEDIQVKRQIKSLLNKLTGSNIHWTSTNMEKIYSSHSRYSVNNSFCSTWMDSIVKSITTFDRMAVEHAMLVAILHANVGTEVGAYFLQNLANKFTELMNSKQELENKSLDNLILGICHLYNFKIFHSSLLYDILNRLTEDLTEKTIECILIAFRTMGSTLRKDDPSGLKTFIQNTQKNTKSLKQSPNNARADFLIDILLAIKNNNLNKIPNYDPTYLEEMKKSIKGVIRKGNRIVSLNISLEDLCRAKDKGKWWIVGSAWEGNSKQEKPNSENSKEENENTAYLLRIAESQRINTDLRKNIFVIIMSAEDYLDAFEKLLALNLSAQQEREIINVIISCCMQEKSYNAYYSVLAQKFCDYDRKYQLSLQYSAWDKIKDLESCQMFQIVNLARLLSHLFIHKGLSISVLKVIEFADLNKQSMRLMRQILIGILLHKDQQLCFDVFQRVAPSPKLRMFRESLRLFISHFLIKNLNNNNKTLNDDEISTLKERCTTVDRILHSDSKVEF